MFVVGDIFAWQLYIINTLLNIKGRMWFPVIVIKNWTPNNKSLMDIFKNVYISIAVQRTSVPYSYYSSVAILSKKISTWQFLV